MESNFDLDINNYTYEELIQFFKLNTDYNLTDLDKRETQLITEIKSINNSIYTSKYKFDIINFIKLGKDILISYFNEIQSNNEMRKNINRFIKNRDPNVGRIINPLAPHQSLQTQIIPDNNVNGYNYKTTTSVYVFNTAARENFFNSLSTDSTYILPVKWKNVISISLAAVNIPNVMFAFSNDLGTNQLYISEDTTNKHGIVVLPQGNYAVYDPSLGVVGSNSFVDALQDAINTQLGTGTRFSVTIDLITNFITISNSTHTFTMNTIKKTDVVYGGPYVNCGPYNNAFINDTSILQKTTTKTIGNYTCNKFSSVTIDDTTDKSLLDPNLYFQTMGYQMGFREIIYSGAKSYTSEAIFNNNYSSYLYFAVDDFTGSQQISNTFGILKNGILDNNILGVIPLTSQPFNFTFDNNANFIYKKREYFGPVDVAKISIKLLNQIGDLVNLNYTDFNFSIQVTSLYDIDRQSIFTMRTPGFV